MDSSVALKAHQSSHVACTTPTQWVPGFSQMELRFQSTVTVVKDFIQTTAGIMKQ